MVMDVTRAKQIFDSEQTYQVMLNGSPIWIESLSADNQTAKVRPLEGGGGIQEVPVTELVEG
ncbi:H-type small acid-soluble spore protein [Desulfoscipio gibsoniae]|uniref:Small acid-soluble spore protein, H-type n=1 Tax=Desulfoscipio gibsoniae DSM 7213 TaxID=767817 RepID=R4KM81_9FIRM|nr:H-type small acid-soluble spore protein [Desulfoscipio gibsoniae]AGL02662.1 small acid-soluble spore protein, H-type [Desulfoscipio gibsoniae DSM 7213]